MKKKLIQSVPLFSTFSESEIEKLAAISHTCHFPAHTVIFSEGAADAKCFIVQEGQVEIIKSLGSSDERILAVREAGTILGEMSLFSPRHTHTASVRSVNALSLLEFDIAQFDTLLRHNPTMAYEIARELSQRLDESENLTILDLRQKNQALTRAYEELKAAQEQIIAKELLEKELQIAGSIQQSILPQEIPQSIELHCGALMIPARAIGGDFYDFIPLAKDLVAVAVGDVSDKGVPAALSMALTYSLVRAEAGKSVSPAETLRRVNRHLLNINVSDMFVTLLYGVVNLSTGMFHYARAGHPPPFVATSGAQALDVPYKLGQALGLFDDLVLDEQEIQLPPGGCLLLYSDGLSEAMNQQGESFPMDHLGEILARGQDSHPQAFCQALWEAMQEFSLGLHQGDDFTVAALRWRPGETH